MASWRAGSQLLSRTDGRAGCGLYGWLARVTSRPSTLCDEDLGPVQSKGSEGRRQREQETKERTGEGAKVPGGWRGQGYKHSLAGPRPGTVGSARSFSTSTEDLWALPVAGRGLSFTTFSTALQTLPQAVPQKRCVRPASGLGPPSAHGWSAAPGVPCDGSLAPPHA